MDLSDFANGRTRGDGMEFVDSNQADSRSNAKLSSAPSTSGHKVFDELKVRNETIPGATTIYRFDDDFNKSVKLPAKVPQGKTFYLVPHLVNTKKPCTLKNKAPKFVPFEPYKAAVSWILYYQP